MTFRFPTLVPDPDHDPDFDLDPTDEAHFEWILEWYLAENRSLRQFETGEIEDDDPDEHGCLTEQKWDEEDDLESLDVNDDPDRDEGSGSE